MCKNFNVSFYYCHFVTVRYSCFSNYVINMTALITFSYYVGIMLMVEARKYSKMFGINIKLHQLINITKFSLIMSTSGVFTSQRE